MPQPRSARLGHFVSQWARRALATWLARDARPSMDECQSCGVRLACEEVDRERARSEIAAAGYRCVDCTLPPLLCSACTVQQHKHNPFHRQDAWDVEKGCWVRQSLGDLGLILNLGHRGEKCVAALLDARRVTVVHSHGVAEIGVRFCACLDDDLEYNPDALQLITHGLWPGSWEKPVTVFTVEVLKDFHLLSLQAQVTAQDFYQYLRRQTDNVQPARITVSALRLAEVKAVHDICMPQDRYRELLFAMQEFIWLRAVKRVGDEPRRGMAAASLAILCPSCPQPGMNLDPTWKARPAVMRYGRLELRELDLLTGDSDRYLEALYTTIDGNFQQNQRDKPSDPNDFALSEGAAYFANTDDFKIYQADLGPLEREVCELRPTIVWLTLRRVIRRVRAISLALWGTEGTEGACPGRSA